jgi:hypothetical protein
VGANPLGWLSDLAQTVTGAPVTGVRSHRTHPLYLRFGAPPPGGRSSTWRREWKASGRIPPFGFDSPNFPQYAYEPGVSVFRARRVPHAYPDVYEVDVSASFDIAMLYRMLANSGRRPYLLEGRELRGRVGFLDEPLLIDAVAEPLPRGTVVTCTKRFAARADALWREQQTTRRALGLI